MMHTLVRRIVPWVGLSLVVVACGGDAITNPTAENVVGSYHTTAFLTTNGSQTTDQLAAGSTLDIALKADGTTSGLLHIAASGTTPASNADMGGTWVLEGAIIHFTQAADTFVRNMAFGVAKTAPNGIRLTGDQTFAGTRVQIVLDKPAPI